MIDSITGTIILSNGGEVQFIISRSGWDQWGNTNEIMGETSEAVEAMCINVMDFIDFGDEDAE